MLIVLENIENNTSGSREFATYLANVAEISKDPTLVKENLYNHSEWLAGAGM